MKKVTPLPALTSLRFFAAALIVVQHTASYFNVGVAFTHEYTLIHGVSFFFVLSGFILAYAYNDLSGRSQTARFIWARVARVLPAHLFTMLAFYVAWVYLLDTGFTATARQTLLNILLLQAWDPYPSTYFSYNGVSWTLSVEMFFYALFPLILISVKKNAFGPLALSSALVIAAILICRLTNAPVATVEDIPSAASWTYIWPPARLLEFTLGVVAGCAFLRYRSMFEASRFQGLLGLAGIAAIIFGSIAATSFGWWLERSGIVQGDVRGWVVISGAGPFFAIGLLLLAGNNGVVTKILSFKPLVFLGEISFSLYLVHQLVIRSMMIKAQPLSGIDLYTQMAVYWVVTLLLSYALWIGVEKPCQKWLNSWFKRSQTKRALASAQ